MCALQVRLKKYIEMRGGDGGPESHVLALPALWVGLLYDPASLAAAVELTRDWTLPEMVDMRDQVRLEVWLQTPHALRVACFSRDRFRRRPADKALGNG